MSFTEPVDLGEDCTELISDLFNFSLLHGRLVALDDEQVSHHTQIRRVCDSHDRLTSDCLSGPVSVERAA